MVCQCNFKHNRQAKASCGGINVSIIELKHPKFKLFFVRAMNGNNRGGGWAQYWKYEDD